MVEEPPRPGPEGSAASPTSTCIISEMSRAALARAPTTSAASCARAATRTRWVNQGAAGSSSLRRLASDIITGSAFSPSADRLPEAPPNCTTCVSLKLASRRRAARLMSEAQPAIFWPSASGVAGCSRVRPSIGVAAMLARKIGESADDGVELLQQRRQRLAELQHHRGVDDVLAGGAPVDVARGLGVALGDLVGQRLDHRHGERRGAARRLDELRGIVERRIAGLDDDRRHAFGDQPGFGDGLRQRGLEAQHVAQRGQVGERLGSEHRGAERVDQTACHVSWP